jgi:hypothetical protein
MIDINKIYRTRDGREVRIYATDGAYSRTLHGAVKNSEGWGSMTWKSCGSVSTLDPSQSPTDLVEVVMLPEYWVVWAEGFNPYILMFEPERSASRTIIHHPAQEKPVN